MEKFRFYLPPIVSELNVKELVNRLYGLKVIKCKELCSYTDKNFHCFIDPESLGNNRHISTEMSNETYILKILNAPHSEDEGYIDAQEAMREHLNMKGLHCQKTILTADGEKKSIEKFPKANGKENEFDTCIVRLFLFLPGQILGSVNVTPDLLYQVGQLVADVSNALQDFHHPGFDNLDRFWNVRNIHLIEEFIQFTPDENKSKLVKEAIRLFSEEVEPYCHELPMGVIHNDLSDQNLIIQQKSIDEDANPVFMIHGILDFDEVLINCTVFELSASLTYLMMVNSTLSGDDDFLHIGGYVISGYLSKRHLSEIEFAILIPAITARLSASLCCGAYNYKLTKNEYSLETSKRGWILLEKLIQTPKEDIHKIWKRIINTTI